MRVVGAVVLGIAAAFATIIGVFYVIDPEGMNMLIGAVALTAGLLTLNAIIRWSRAGRD